MHNGCARRTLAILMDGLSHQIDVEDTKQIEDASDLKDHLEDLTKAPTPNVLESQANHSTRTKFIAMDVKNLATMQKDWLELNKCRKDDNSWPQEV